MGKGDLRTKRGKISRGTHGKSRPRKAEGDRAGRPRRPVARPARAARG